MPPNDFPRFLYKYLGPSIPNEWLRALLIDSKLYLKSPADFNDPFDMRGCIVDEPSVMISDLSNTYGAMRPEALQEGPREAGIGQRRGCHDRIMSTAGRLHPATGSHLPSEDTAPPCAVALHLLRPTLLMPRSHWLSIG